MGINLEPENQHQAMADWLTARETLDRLGLKPQTLYAYASRGRIEAKPDEADPRRSLYRASDVARLVERKARGRRDAAIAEDAIAWGEPVLASAITTVARGRLWYRGRDAALLSDTAELEDVARLLWGCGAARFPPQRSRIPPGSTRERMFAAVAARAASSGAVDVPTPEAVQVDAAALLDLVADAVAGGPGEGPIHARLALAWGCYARGADLIRRALVLMADHELNASTFAVRVAASTRASLAACTLAGLATLTGPLHGGMASRVRELVAAARRDGADSAVGDRLRLGRALPGFGHPLYPEGDPRAGALLAAFTPPAVYRHLRAAAAAPPNIDFALTALADAIRLPGYAPFAIFATARCTGWIAHALEQSRTGRLIRPRARYVGPPPEA